MTRKTKAKADPARAARVIEDLPKPQVLPPSPDIPGANPNDTFGVVHTPMPVRGYQPQPEENVQLVNEGKAIEAQLIAYLGKLAALDRTDKRMLAIAKTDIQTGCMWAYRAVFQPSET